MNNSPSRRHCIVAALALAFITSGLALSLNPCSAQALNNAPPAQLPQFVAGADISLLAREEQLGQIYRDNGKPNTALAILKAHGSNCMRLRLWVNPSGEDIYVNDLPYTIALGRRIKRAGLLLMLDIHYSDTWADPGHQLKPAAWNSLPLDQLVGKVHDYTQSVIEAMRKQGAMPDIVAVGNEISGGMLWPDGLDYGPGHDFSALGRLLKAGIKGVGDGSGNSPRPLIMIHIDKGGDWGATQWFFDGIAAQGVQFDIIGESYYPFFQGSLQQLKTTLGNAARRYRKPIIVAETGYPYESSPRVANAPPGAMSYPETPQGQLQFLQALTGVIRATQGGFGRGLMYWEPEWIPVHGLQSSWETTTLFDNSGNALPGLFALTARANP